jgi:CSLREA domain-containing protein/uncharacterized repeat protein (TIGR01451 family)
MPTPLSPKPPRLALAPLLVTLLFLLIPASAFAETVYTVNTTQDETAANGQCSLREAVIASNTGSTSGDCTPTGSGAHVIDLPAGTYTLTITGDDSGGAPNAAVGDLDVTGQVSIVGAGPASTIIQAGTSKGTGIDSIFTVNPFNPQTGLSSSANGFAFSLTGATLRFGRNPATLQSTNDFGGAFYFDAGPSAGHGSLTLDDDVITENEVANGFAGGIATFNGGQVSITNTTFSRNVAQASGGTSSSAGGLFIGFTNFSQSLTISKDVFEGNTSTGSAGGILLAGRANGVADTETIEDTSIVGNRATGANGADQSPGGGMVILNAAPTISDSVISGNSSTEEGGGIFSEALGLTTVTHSVIANNSVTSNAQDPNSGQGGGIWTDESDFNATFDRITGNSASSVGSGLFKANEAGTVTATNDWWGCNGGPSAAPCDTAAIQAGSKGTLTTSPFLQLKTSLTSASLKPGEATQAQASFLTNSLGAAVAPTDLTALDGDPVGWSATGGALSEQQNAISAGKASAKFTAGNTPGPGSVSAKVDSQTSTANLTVVAPDLTIAKSHSISFRQGDEGDTYSIAVSNGGNGPTTGTVTVKDTLPAGLTATAIAGEGWECEPATLTCTRADALSQGGHYPAITVTVDVAPEAPASVTNVASVAGGGEFETANDKAEDPTAIAPVAGPTCPAEGVTATTEAGKPVTIVFNCTDSSTLAYSLVVGSGPAHGTLGAIVGDEVTYTPEAGFAGQDGFQVRASANGKQAIEQVTVTVTPAAEEEEPPAEEEKEKPAEEEHLHGRSPAPQNLTESAHCLTPAQTAVATDEEFSFTLLQPGTVSYTLRRKGPSQKRCSVALAKRAKARRDAFSAGPLVHKLDAVTSEELAAGPHTISLAAITGGEELEPGQYTLLVRETVHGERPSRQARAHFRVRVI